MGKKTHRSAVTATENEFIIRRVFNASREEVFRAWTESDRLAQWWGPKGFRFITSRLDLRPGGIFHYCMMSPDGREMWGRFVYREVESPRRLVFVVSFSDSSGNITRHPMAPAWPLEVLNILTLEETDGKTMLELRGIPVNARSDEVAAFRAGYESMQKGFSGTMDQLDKFLETHFS